MIIMTVSDISLEETKDTTYSFTSKEEAMQWLCVLRNEAREMSIMRGIKIYDLSNCVPMESMLV